LESTNDAALGNDAAHRATQGSGRLDSDKVRRMFGILIRFDLKDEAAARGFDALAEQTIAAVQAMEPETLMYVVHRVEDAPLSRIFYEVYASRDAHAQHELTEHMKHAFAELGQYVESARMEFLDAPSGKLFQAVNASAN
jgi:quinol monooxygenase YgiN